MKNFLLFAVSIFACIVITEFLFVLYEKAVYSIEYKFPGDIIDLQKLNYNESTISRKQPDAEFRILSFGDSF